MWIFVASQTGWTVGFFASTGVWNPIYDFDTKEYAAEMVHYLNGGESKIFGLQPIPTV